MKKRTFILIILFSFPTCLFAQFKTDVQPTLKKGNVLITTGVGFPSILRLYLKKETKQTEYHIEGYGPLIFKLDYVLLKNFSAGLDATYNYTDLYYFDDGQDNNNKWSVYRYGAKVKEFSANLRLNYHFYNKKKWDLYAGAGMGYGAINVETYSTAPRPSFYLNYNFPKPLSFESTAGARYFLNKHIGFYSEIGLGRSWVLYKKYFLPEAVIQGGISIKF